MIRAVILDFDGLIVDTETALIDAYGDVHREDGVAFDRALFLRSVGHADFSFDPWRGFGPSADRDALEARRRAFNRARGEASGALPGVVDLLDQARGAGLRVGLASNSGHEHVEGHLRRLGLLERFALVACREDVPSPKPEPDLYRLVLNRFGLSGAAAIAFEDSATGIVAAKRARLWVVAVPNPSTDRHDLSGADVRLASLADCRLGELTTRFGG